ncbi:unnamed protein product [Coffea canephora]|uniref:Uncharacterized protein n=1 Tax=Coffea canephora TaxID=49390 RepID=A0A068U0E8_COFCA|nr:unnamed protein product [Coffea canephora]
MDQNQQQQQKDEVLNRESLEKRPGILMIGSPTVGKRTLLSRLLSLDFETASDSSSSSDTFAYGWTINTKYYVADVSLWMAHLNDEFAIQNLPGYDQLAALVMVFDMNDLSSFSALKDWVAQNDIQKFDILLCIGNKVDLLPGHPAHVEYRRCLLKSGESSGDFSLELDYGISETEGSSLLGDDEPSWEMKRSCMDWCIEHNIEYIEACATNADFDKCLSVDGDLQGVQRLYGALSAHMWPGMVLKSGDKIHEPSLPEQEELSEEESDFELEYEILSAGSADPWDDTEVGWVSAKGDATTSGTSGVIEQNFDSQDCDQKSQNRSVEGQPQPLTSTHGKTNEEEAMKLHAAGTASEPDEGTTYDFEDLDQLMSEIGNMRNSLRLLPDFQRREMAAKLAMKMAAMFGDSSEDEEGLN